MAQEISLLSDTGAKEMRVLEALTPLTGVLAPAVQALYLGQTFIDTAASKVYMAIAIDSVDPADDWKEV